MLDAQRFQQAVLDDLLIAHEPVQRDIRLEETISQFLQFLPSHRIVHQREELFRLVLMPHIAAHHERSVVDILDDQGGLPVVLPV